MESLVDIFSGPADIFVFELADAGTAGTPEAYTVGDGGGAGDADFGADDALDLRDLLQGETDGTLADYLNITAVGSDTVIEVSSSGGFSGGYDVNQVDTTITLTDVDLTGGLDPNTQLDTIIQNLLSSGQLITD